MKRKLLRDGLGVAWPGAPVSEVADCRTHFVVPTARGMEDIPAVYQAEALSALAQYTAAAMARKAVQQDWHEYANVLHGIPLEVGQRVVLLRFFERDRRYLAFSGIIEKEEHTELKRGRRRLVAHPQHLVVYDSCCEPGGAVVALDYARERAKAARNGDYHIDLEDPPPLVVLPQWVEPPRQCRELVAFYRRPASSGYATDGGIRHRRFGRFRKQHYAEPTAFDTDIYASSEEEFAMVEHKEHHNADDHWDDDEYVYESPPSSSSSESSSDLMEDDVGTDDESDSAATDSAVDLDNDSAA